LFSIDFFVSFFVYIFVSLLARLRENDWKDLHEIFREGVEYPWDDLTFLVNSEKLRDAAMRNTGTGFVVLSHHSLFAVGFICPIHTADATKLFCRLGVGGVNRIRNYM